MEVGAASRSWLWGTRLELNMGNPCIATRGPSSRIFGDRSQNGTGRSSRSVFQGHLLKQYCRTVLRNRTARLCGRRSQKNLGMDHSQNDSSEAGRKQVSGGRDLTASGRFPRQFGREVARQHKSWMESWLSAFAALKALNSCSRAP